jgi:hypothetical protein
VGTLLSWRLLADERTEMEAARGQAAVRWSP